MTYVLWTLCSGSETPTEWKWKFSNFSQWPSGQILEMLSHVKLYSHKGRRHCFLLTSLLTVVTLILIVQVVTMAASLSSNKGNFVSVRKTSPSLPRDCRWQTRAGSFRLHLLQRPRLLQQKRCHQRRRRCLHCEMLWPRGDRVRDFSWLEGHGLVQVVCQYSQSYKQRLETYCQVHGGCRLKNSRLSRRTEALRHLSDHLDLRRASQQLGRLPQGGDEDHQHWVLWKSVGQYTLDFYVYHLKDARICNYCGK